jgi:cytochrome c oxidase subunit II
MSSSLLKLFSRQSLLLVLATILSSGCSRIDHKQSTLDPKGLIAQNQYDVFMLSVWITIFLFCAVGGCLLYVLWKYRVKNEEEALEVPPQTHGNPKVEVSLILASTVILVILAIPTLQGVVLMNRVPDPNDKALLEKLKLDKKQIEGAITVNVTGKRFFWVFEYPQFGIVTANELVFPASKAVRINLRSEDVIHSFWLPKLAGKMDVMPGHENFMWFIADVNKIIRERVNSDGKPYKEDRKTAMPSVFDGKMRDAVFKKQDFFAEFEPVGGVFYGQCAEFCGNSHAYMSFRGLAQTNKDFDAWVSRMQVAQNPNLLPSPYDHEKEYAKDSIVTFADDSLGFEREYRSPKGASKGASPNLSSGVWEKAHSDDYELGKEVFNRSQCGQCHALNRTGVGSKGPNLTLFGLRTSLAAGWMRNDRKSLSKWLENSNEVKFGNLMWNAKSVINFEPTKEQKEEGTVQHPLRELKDHPEKIEQLVTYLLGQR